MIRLIFLIYSLSISFQALSADVIVGVGDQNQEALGFENGRFVGSLANHYQCVFDNSGLSFDIRLLPQARLLLLLKRGELSMGLPLVKLESRDEFAVFTRLMFDTPFVLYSRKDIKIDHDLSDYTFTLLRDSASIELATKRKAKFKGVTSWTQALELARLGRYDGAIIPAVIIENLGEEYFEGLNKLDFGTLPVSMYVSRQIDNTESLVEKLNAAIDACLL